MEVEELEVEGCVVTSGDEEEDWVPLENTFVSRGRGEGEGEGEEGGEGPLFAVCRGSSDAVVVVTFTGSLGEGGEEESELSQEVSFERLAALHRQMMALFPEQVQEELLPRLPSVPRGLWSYLLSVEVPPGLYDSIAAYLEELAARCSLPSVLDIVFENAFWTADRYEAAWSDLNRRHYEEERAGLQRQWAGLMEGRGSTAFTSMRQLHDFYEEEDGVAYELTRIEQRLYGFQARPFEDLSEIARKCRDDAARRSKDPSLAVSAQLQALHEERELHETHLEASESLHELALERLQAEAGRLEGVCQRMQEDRRQVGGSWDRRAQGRLDRFEDKLNRGIVELLRRQVRRLADQKDRALLAMAVVEEGPGMEEEVGRRERVVFGVQLRLFEIQLRLHEEEEKKLRLQVRYAEGAELAAVLARAEAIPSKMSKIRLKMLACKEQLQQPDKRSINVSESYSASFAAQKKEAVARREEQRREAAMTQQRHRTIQRVKQYMEKHPAATKKLPPRYQPPSQRQEGRRRSQQKRAEPSPPSSSRVASTAALTRSALGKKEAPRKTTPAQAKKSAAHIKKATPSKSGSKAGAPVKSSSPPPPCPPPPAESVRVIAETANALPPPPPPPAVPSPPPPPPPPQPSPAQHKVATPTPTPRRGKQHSTPKSTTFDLSAIIKARKNLKRSVFGAALNEGELAHTSDEVACLIRSGVRPEGSLTRDGAALLSQRLQHIKDVTSYSDPESEGEEWT